MQTQHFDLFQSVIALLHEAFLPQLKLCASAGQAVVKTDDDMLLNNTLAVEMVINILSERGFTVGVSRETAREGVSVDLSTGIIKHRSKTWYVFTVGFPPARK